MNCLAALHRARAACRRARAAAALATPALAFALLGCGAGSSDADSPAPEVSSGSPEPDRAEPSPLVAPDLWRVAGEADDPERALRPGAKLCADDALRVEGSGVEVSTAACNYASLVQPSRHAVGAGDTVTVRAWWGVLAADTPARGELAVFFGDDLVWHDAVDIPGRPDTRDVSFVSPRGYPAGTPLVFHVHNHGTNRWTIGEISARPRG